MIFMMVVILKQIVQTIKPILLDYINGRELIKNYKLPLIHFNIIMALRIAQSKIKLGIYQLKVILKRYITVNIIKLDPWEIKCTFKPNL